MPLRSPAIFLIRSKNTKHMPAQFVPAAFALLGLLARSERYGNEFFVKVRLAQEYGAPIESPVQAQRRMFETELTKHAVAHQAARATGNLSRMRFTQLALDKVEASLAALDLLFKPPYRYRIDTRASEFSGRQLRSPCCFPAKTALAFDLKTLAAIMARTLDF